VGAVEVLSTFEQSGHNERNSDRKILEQRIDGKEGRDSRSHQVALLCVVHYILHVFLILHRDGIGQRAVEVINQLLHLIGVDIELQRNISTEDTRLEGLHMPSDVCLTFH
jgi:hypothetical protein